MYIGEVSKRTGLSAKTIRFYEQKGLITPNRAGRYRVYQQSDIDILLLIKEAKAFGIALATIKEVIVYKDGDVDWTRVRSFLTNLKVQLMAQATMLQQKIDMIDQCYEDVILKE